MVANTFFKMQASIKVLQGKSKKQACNNFRCYTAKGPVKGSDKNLNKKIKPV